jgi:lincosamide and streptogramin A transport system ATP-binding/permease protein
MSLISVNDLTFCYDTHSDAIFEHVSFQIDTDWKLGFIGRNGRGKTTFLRLLQGQYEYRGSITTSVSFDYFPFEIEDESLCVMEIMKNAIAPFTQWEKEMEDCIKKRDMDSMEEYGRIFELYQAHDGYMIENMIEKEISKLHVDSSVLTRAYATLSFGERTKIMLAALFLKKNNFLLIDEPTNHLDLEGRQTLAEYLRLKNGFLLVSHDRSFLDECIDHVISINRADIEVMKGNYSVWRQNRERQDQYELDQNEQLKKDITNLTQAAKRAAGWSDQVEATKIGTHAADRGAIGHKAAKMMKRAKSIENRRLAAAEEKKGLLKNIEQVDTLKMNLISFPGKKLIEAEDLSLFYGPQKIVSGINFILRMGARIAICGKNGSGKTSLLKLLLGDDIAYTGRFSVAQGLRISYISQDTSQLTGRLEDYAVSNGLDESIFKTVLRQLDFNRSQFEKDTSEFSAGQKKKVLLAKSLAEAANVFLWDEPLNYIDVLSRIQIEELILKYRPTMLFIEHDRIFTDKIATEIIQLP